MPSQVRQVTSRQCSVNCGSHKLTRLQFRHVVIGHEMSTVCYNTVCSDYTRKSAVCGDVICVHHRSRPPNCQGD